MQQLRIQPSPRKTSLRTGVQLVLHPGAMDRLVALEIRRQVVLAGVKTKLIESYRNGKRASEGLRPESAGVAFLGVLFACLTPVIQAQCGETD